MALYALDTGGGGSTPSTQQREYNNFWDVMRYAFEDLVNHPSTWGGLSAANSPGSTSTITSAIDKAETLDSSVFEPVSVDGNEVGQNVDSLIESNASISDAFSYGKVQGDTVEDKLTWLINNDPENAQGWMEQLLGFQASKEATNDARAYEKMMQDTRIQRVAKDLEAAGINPILAYQYLSGSGTSVNAASMPDSNVSTNAVARQSNKNTTQATNVKSIMAIITALIALTGVTLKAIV